ncbi:MAG TPA: hypothetical protein VFF03_00360 [Rhodocyclaceae bacterium]|nr:hypothetical protein [Rhodocyclaceae bacterium]
MRPCKTAIPSFFLALMVGHGAWAGEILVGPDKSEIRTPGARNQRERAGAYQRGAEVLPEEEEGGFLSPSGGAPAQERAFENRAKARAYQQGVDGPAAIQGLPAGLGELTGQDRARDLRGRAKVYTGSGSGQDMDLSHVGADGIPIVPCRGEADNVAARIGEDAVSGSVFYVLRQGKQVKVRCK